MSVFVETADSTLTVKGADTYRLQPDGRVTIYQGDKGVAVVDAGKWVMVGIVDEENDG